jgi:hypothetical protein
VSGITFSSGFLSKQFRLDLLPRSEHLSAPARSGRE